MKSKILAAVAVAGLVSLGACNKAPQAENVEAVADNVADNMDAMADNMTNDMASDSIANQADAVREAGENKAEAIDNAADHGASNATLNAMAK